LSSSKYNEPPVNAVMMLLFVIALRILECRRANKSDDALV